MTKFLDIYVFFGIFGKSLQNINLRHAHLKIFLLSSAGFTIHIWLMADFTSLFTNSNFSKSQRMYYKNIFQNSNLDWKNIFMLPRIVTKDTRLQVFQYKLLNIVLYLNKMLFRFGKIDSPLCSFCKMTEETPLHLFYNCIKRKLLWDQEFYL